MTPSEATEVITLRLCYTTGRSLAWSAQRPQDAARLDFATGSFTKAEPTAPTRPLTAETGIFSGRYFDSFATAPGQLWDGPLIVAVHDLTDPANPRCLGEGYLDCFAGYTMQALGAFFTF